MRLKYIEQVSFAKSEHTNFTELAKKKRWKLGRDEVACLVSMTGDQLVFVFALGEVKSEKSKQEVMRSERLRLTSKHAWNPTMLGNYAAKVGIELDGIKRFEETYAELWSQT